MLKIYRKQKSNRVHAYTKSVRVPIAATHRIGTKSSDENCMISETLPPTIPSTFGSAIHSTVVQNANDTSMPTSLILRTPAVAIPAGLFIWPCVWLWRTACRTARLHGTYGETTEYLCPGLQFKTGLKRRGKKAEQRITTEYLDGVLADFSGYAVERGYRRHRKMQKSVYRVRTQNHISRRVAIDMQRDEQSQGRLQTITTLHDERIGMLCCR